jgi:osmotically-inducible protein OsmY
MNDQRLKVSIALLALSATPIVLSAQQPDNTAVNKRDAQKGAVTAGEQNNNKSDTKLAAQIRRSVVKDKSLSTYAHNVKIVAQNGTVTLKGPVKSDDEKRSVEQKAEEIAGKGHVNSELSVKEGTEADRLKSK